MNKKLDRLLRTSMAATRLLEQIKRLEREQMRHERETRSVLRLIKKKEIRNE